MLDDFLLRAILAGIGLALVAGPLGCFVVWRQMAFFGETMAHASLLGVALSLVFQIDILWGAIVLCFVCALGLLLLQKKTNGQLGGLGDDALLGVVSHSALALGLVTIGLISWQQVNIMGLLFGDILSVSRTDLAIIYVGGFLVSGVLFKFWKPLLLLTISPEIARAEKMAPERANLVLVLLLAITIAIAIKIVGVLLITALLIIPASAARAVSSTPEQMALLSIVVGVVSVLGGLFGSLQFDTASGPSIVVVAAVIFATSLFAKRFIRGA